MSTSTAQQARQAIDAEHEDAVAYTIDMEDDDFEKFVKSNISQGSPAKVWDVLLDPDVAHRTKATLAGMLTSVRGQLETYRVDPSTNTAEWAKSASRFYMMATRRQAQAKTAVREAQHLFDEDQRREARHVLRKLAVGVNAHRLACIAADLTPEPHDLELWKLFDELTLPANDRGADEVSLALLVTSGAWFEGKPTTPAPLVRVCSLTGLPVGVGDRCDAHSRDVAPCPDDLRSVQR